MFTNLNNKSDNEKTNENQKRKRTQKKKKQPTKTSKRINHKTKKPQKFPN